MSKTRSASSLVARVLHVAPATRASSVFALLRFWRARQRTRIQLSRLSEGELRDVGLTREMARRECAKAPWED